MKLRNKKTGKIAERVDITIREEGVVFNNDETYNSLTELNDEWEDYEEPKEYWCITGRGNLHYLQDMTDENDKDHREIGNYFDTKEEAEKAVEKLKAWKRLKDGGFYFTIDVTTDGKYSHNFILRLNCTKEKINKTFTECEQYRKDLHLLFGGEE